MKALNRQNGFTLIELLVVIAIIAHSDSSPNNQDLRWIRDRTSSRR